MRLNYMVRSYTKRGEMGFEEYRDNLYEVLQLYVQFARQKDHPRPTLWIWDGKNYVRVHDFQFVELNPETYSKYLKERILETDYLLEAEE